MNCSFQRTTGITLGLLLLGGALASAHVVEQIYADWRELGESWQLVVQYDAGYAIPETRDVPDLSPPTRDWLLQQDGQEWAALRVESARYLKEMLTVRIDGRAVAYGVSYPDWETSPPDFPLLLNEVAYFRAVVTHGEPGQVELAIAEGDYPKLAIGRGDDLLLLAPGEQLLMREGKVMDRFPQVGLRSYLLAGAWIILFAAVLGSYRQSRLQLFRRVGIFLAAQFFADASRGLGLIMESTLERCLLATALAIAVSGLAWGARRGEGPRPLRLSLIAVSGLLVGILLTTEVYPADRIVPSDLRAGLFLVLSLAQIAIVVGVQAVARRCCRNLPFDRLRANSSLWFALVTCLLWVGCVISAFKL